VTHMDEQHHQEIDVVQMYIERARSRTEQAAAELRKSGAEEHLIEATEAAARELSDGGRRLMQGTLFAVPDAQASL